MNYDDDDDGDNDKEHLYSIRHTAPYHRHRQIWNINLHASPVINGRI